MVCQTVEIGLLLPDVTKGKIASWTSAEYFYPTRPDLEKSAKCKNSNTTEFLEGTGITINFATPRMVLPTRYARVPV